MNERDQRRAAEALGEESYKVMGSHPAEDILREAADLAKKAGATKVDSACEPGDPVDVLVTVIDKEKVDLCVVGNRGLNSLAGRLLGSVPANISHRASCDVLIVHPRGGRRGARRSGASRRRPPVASTAHCPGTASGSQPPVGRASAPRWSCCTGS